MTGAIIGARRLRLVPLTAADACELHPVLDDERLYRHIGGQPLDPEALAARFARLEAGAPAGAGQTWCNWVVRLRDANGDDAAIGTVQATVTARSTAVAWVIGTAWQGHGYATEAAIALVDRLLADGTQVIRAHVHPEHVASRRVAARAGLERTGAVDDDGEEIWERNALTRPAGWRA